MNRIPREQYRPQLTTLRTNFSVIEVAIWSEQAGEWIAEVLSNRSDFAAAALVWCHFFVTYIAPVLQRGITLLKKLALTSCSVDDTALELMH